MKLNEVSQLWKDILCQSKGDSIVFKQMTVRYAWANVAVASEQWCHNKDSFESVPLYLVKHGAEESTRLLEMPEAKGARSLALDDCAGLGTTH